MLRTFADIIMNVDEVLYILSEQDPPAIKFRDGTELNLGTKANEAIMAWVAQQESEETMSIEMKGEQYRNIHTGRIAVVIGSWQTMRMGHARKTVEVKYLKTGRHRQWDRDIFLANFARTNDGEDNDVNRNEAR